jgi:flavodoxin
MNINLMYFSQTGNTKKIAEVMQDTFNDSGHNAQITSFMKAHSDDMAKADLIGIGAPCFASQAPSPVKSYLHALPDLNGRSAFVFATSGGAPGRVLYDITEILRQKNVKVVGGFLSRGTCFYPAPCLVNRFPGRPNNEDLENAKHFASTLIDHIENGAHVEITGNRNDAIKPMWGLYDFMAKFNTDPMMRLLVPKPKMNQDLCNQCMSCAAECPVDNITFNPYPEIHKKCIRCCRCIISLPSRGVND